ncbi:H-NS histone family protein [Paraburkholderia acidisoli]|jgi:DNA-binding protein H-NS|uniref:H-NS histone family protein n=1 Tax=Paraburkholderia acidisoli TaxID=2571748 RepID=A0A7Z2JHS8_9BURK|nr:H-NS histone family protein [Paraburkholderia acidisoli]QGZ65046.1 H-NS histone family protein [Paraburkholderia acidisoli]
MVTLDAIQLKISKLQKQAESLVQQRTSSGLTKIRDLMAKHGLSVADIEQFIGKRRGRKPAAGAKSATKTAVKRTVAPKYADPKTGATWTGRGLAPVWIRDVKNRSKFLIDGSAANGAAKPAARKTAAKKTAKTAARPAAKKTAIKRTLAKKAARKAAAH